ncbi:MAG TPA: fluoride efflux transporter CrcB [Vicinamibacterales bacterium]|nr:fluoride efflux transporter CrcB [Vicinamibacterales bacterium]HXR43492.1 fluoride efflux transporter CrcB [Pseudolysinimonas sp.]
MTPLLVAVGGALGSVLRYWAGGLAQQAAGGAAGGFPIGTLLVNVVGCIAIGALAQLGERSSLAPETRALLMTGVLGGFTTFSAFANETVLAWRAGAMAVAAANVVLSVALCIAGVAIGRAAVGLFVK